jgi:PTH1 family peptidyl-tRNA hydrolase
MAKQRQLVVGLGNPGDRYEKTRHNAGFWVIDELSRILNIGVGKKKFNAVFGKGITGQNEVILAKPMSYMNLSGEPVRRLVDFYEIQTGDLLVIHDDIDLALGRLKIKAKGGHGGHNGLKSIIAALGHNNFSRVRIGIGRNRGEGDVTGHVLGRFSKSESEIISKAVQTAADAAKLILQRDLTEAMNRYNGTGGTIE